MTITIYQGDVIDMLRIMPAESVHTVVTSPPYWGLRDYGVAGQLGLEKTPQLYIEAMVAVFNEVHRVLRKDGTLWLNIGDCYAQTNYGSGGGWAKNADDYAGQAPAQNRSLFKDPGYAADVKPKNLVGIPWRLAFALQAAGWYLRQDIIWHKPNPMPESTRDRPTKAHEYLFLMSKSPKYYYDFEAIREECVTKENRPHAIVRNRELNYDSKENKLRGDKQRGHGRRHQGFNERWDKMTKAEQAALGRNKRSVWSVATRPFKEAHFATFPPQLVEPCVIAGAPVGGIVLDPFFGSGTTGQVATMHGRDCIGIELNAEYITIAKKRLIKTPPVVLDGALF